MDVTVVVATFGEYSWVELAHKRAVPSVEGVPVLQPHGRTLHDARNEGLEAVKSEWVCFLDADDQLTPGYFEAMALGTADLRAPSVSYVKPNGNARPPYMPRVAGHAHDCRPGCLRDGNWLVVGTVARTELLQRVGGWRDFAWSEDWDLWLRCHLAGASIEAIPDAVYRAHVRHDSRNRAPSREEKLAAHHAIHEANFGVTA